jgi:hypothetical protein
MNDPGDVRRRYLRFAEHECRGYSALYDELATAIAVDDGMVPSRCGHLFADVLAEASKQRPVVWLSNEAPGVIPEITALAPERDGPQRFLRGRTRFTDGRREDELLGLAHPHGAELTWL